MNSENLAGYKDVVTGATEPPGAEDAPIAIPASPELRGLLGIAVAALAIAALYFAQEVLMPITLAVMLSFVLSPVVNLLQRARLWRAPAVILTVLAALALVGLIGTLIGSQAAILASRAPEYAQTIEAKVTRVQGFAVSRIATITNALTPARPALVKAHTPAPRTVLVPAGPGAAPAKPVLVQIADQQTSPLVVAKAILMPIVGPLGTMFLVLIVAIFVMMQKEDLRDRFIRLLGSNDLHRTTLAMDDAGQRLSKYFLSQLAVNTTFGVVIGVGLWLLGIPSPAMFGILAGLLRFVPYIGSALAALAPMALGAAIDPGWATAIYVVAMFLTVETVTGYAVEPMLYGHSTGLSPFSVIIAAVFWTWLWGPVGLIMSTPLTLCLVVLGRHVKSLEFFDVLLGDRPALSPVESFYQRILANNPDEALAQAELLLADRSLAQYYDEVVIAGLKLAAEDEARGIIDRPRAISMTRSIIAVIEDLQDHVNQHSFKASANPQSTVGSLLGGSLLGGLPLGGSPSGGSPDPGETERHGVACIAGQNPFDDTVLAMLAQLLAQCGQDARIIPHAMVTRDRIAQLDLTGVTVIAISYLERTGSAAHLRYLIKRLRQRAPAATIIVGLWSEGEAPPNGANLPQAVGADKSVNSLAAATTAIIDAYLNPAPVQLTA